MEWKEISPWNQHLITCCYILDFIQEFPPVPARECRFSNLEAFPTLISTQLLSGISISSDLVLRSTSIGSFHAQELNDVWN
jgi:hypothetical protein